MMSIWQKSRWRGAGGALGAFAVARWAWLANGVLNSKELPKMSKRNPAITVAVIGALGVILAAIIGAILQPSWWRSERKAEVDLVIAGTVVDQTTNQAVAQASISIAGRTETYVTEDNGNFRIDLRTRVPQRLRLHVIKSGFQPLDISVEPPAENLILQLRKP